MAKRPLRVRVAPGLEDIAAAELAAVGCEVEVVPGGVLAKEADLPKLLVHSRIGSGVTFQLGSVRMDKLPDALRGMPWRNHVNAGQKVEVVLRGVKGRNLNRKCEAVIARHAARGRGRGGRMPPVRVWLIGDGKGQKIDVAVEAARDLWKRGWRTLPGRAPLRENLAAAVLRAANWTGDEVLVDPMCGSGTLGIEAAHIALGRAPGAYRSFGASWWPNGVGKAIDQEKKRKGKQKNARIWLSDRDGRQLHAARENAKKAHVDRHLKITELAFADLEPPSPEGLIVMNPPYGDRIAATERTYRAIADVLGHRWGGYRYAILLPDARLARFLPGQVDTGLFFPHGGKKVWLARGRIG